MPTTAPMAEMMRPSKRNMLRICRSVAPRLRRVAASAFLSMMSIESDDMMLKHATISMNVRKTYASTFSICMMLNVSDCCSNLSSTLYFEPTISRICFFTAARSLPGFSRICSDESMPSWSNSRRAKPMEHIMWSRSYFA